MDNPGAKNIAFGLIWFVVGVAVTVATQGGGHGVIAIGAILVGGAQFVVGLVQFSTGEKTPAVDSVLPQATPEFKALLRTMISSAECDGPLDDAKVESIRTELKKLTKEDFYLIRDVAAAMAKEGVKISDYLTQVQSNLSIEIKQLLVRTSAILLVARKARGEAARRFMEDLATALQMTEQQCEEACVGVIPASAGT
jgi:uncharacterized membrane protein YebE (DUF533 family)